MPFGSRTNDSGDITYQVYATHTNGEMITATYNWSMYGAIDEAHADEMMQAYVDAISASGVFTAIAGTGKSGLWRQAGTPTPPPPAG